MFFLTSDTQNKYGISHGTGMLQPVKAVDLGTAIGSNRVGE
jgi:hypothetical protein